MSVTIAKEAGFCFGVKRATDRLEEAITRQQRAEQNPRVDNKSIVTIEIRERKNCYRQTERKSKKYSEEYLYRAEHHIRVSFLYFLGVFCFFLVNEQSKAHGEANLTYRSCYEEYACKAEAEQTF